MANPGTQQDAGMQVILRAEKLTVRIAPDYLPSVTTSFDIGGLETRLSELAAACNWTP